MRRGLIIVGAAGAVVALADQLSKALVVGRVAPGGAVDIVPMLSIVHVRNTGIAFGLFSGGGVWVVLGSLLVAFVLIASLAAVPPTGRLATIGIGMVMGGAAGNLTDRVRAGHVTDFVKLPHWPAFNVADMGIVCGVVLIALASMRAPDTQPGSNVRQEDAHAP